MTDEELDALEKAMQLAAGNMIYLPPHLTRQVSSAITTLRECLERSALVEARLRAQLAEQVGYKNDYKAAFIETNDDWQEAKARADRAEQRVATLEHEVRLREAALDRVKGEIK